MTPEEQQTALLRRRLRREQAIRLAAEDIGERTTRQLDAQVQALTAANAQLAAARDELEVLVDRLAMPILEVWPGLVGVPVIGDVGPRRAQLLRAELEDVVAQRHVRVVVIDVSGAGVVDTPTLSRLAALLQAARRLGCRVILAGLPQEIASAATKDVDLDGIALYPDTTTSVAAGLRALGLTIVPAPP